MSGPETEPHGLTRAARHRHGLDWAAPLGLIAAVLVVLVAVLAGGAPGAYLDLPSAMIVFGGTVSVTAISFSAADMGTTLRLLPGALVRHHRPPRAVAHQMLLLADVTRRSGPAKLRTLLPEFRPDPWFHRCALMIAEGLPADEMERLLAEDACSAVAQQHQAAAVLRRAAEVAPAMGLIGTLVGLVQMLGSLNNPAAIGPAMAVALLTTLYGAVLGNMVLTPLAGKLEDNADHDGRLHALYAAGAGSIARQENPVRLEMRLNALLPPGQQVRLTGDLSS